MPIVSGHVYAVAEVEAIARASEYQPTMFHSEAEAHGFARHIGITNAEMLRRAERVQRGIVAITAFPDNRSAFVAGAALLNCRVGQAALNDMAAGHTGMRAVITWEVQPAVTIRYVTASNQLVKTMPGRWFRLVVDRSEERPHGLHLQTLFGLLDPDARNQARVESRTGQPVRTHT